MSEATKIIAQKLRKSYPIAVEVGIKYYSILSAINNLELTNREIQLIAFTAVRGTISSGGARESFLQMFGSTKGFLSNMIGRLVKRSLLVKKDGRISVNPIILLDFECPLVLQINLSVDGTKDL